MKKRYLFIVIYVLFISQFTFLRNSAEAASPPMQASTVLALDGTDWLLGTDPENQGKERQWWLNPIDGAKQVPVPGVIQDQDAFPEYHGVVWYWKDFRAPKNPHPQGRYILKFWSVDYKADVWVNDTYLGSHKVQETSFEFDATKAIKPNAVNRLAVRVVNPVDEHEIDGITLGKSTKRTKGTRPIPHTNWGEQNFGGILDSVELMVTPALRVSDVFARPDYKTGIIKVQVEINNRTDKKTGATLQCTVSGASEGRVLDLANHIGNFPAGKNQVELTLKVPNWKLWELNEPYLYRVTARVVSDKSPNSMDEFSVRTGFRDFRFEDGYFKLNDKRIILRCSHTGGETPISYMIPHDPDIDRKLILHMKEMGFNSVRYFCHAPRRRQADLCDELGMMVYCEPQSGWFMENWPGARELMEISMTGLIMRNRNHPSVTIWGILNEEGQGRIVFNNAVEMLPLVRSLDDTRVVMLNSGRFDGHDLGGKITGLCSWKPKSSPDVPSVAFNPSDKDASSPYHLWKPGVVSSHSGRGDGVSSTIRFIVPSDGSYKIEALFGKPDSYRFFVNGDNKSDLVKPENNQMKINHEMEFKKGARLDFACVLPHDIDTSIRITGSGEKLYDLEKDITIHNNPFGNWHLGSMPIDKENMPGVFTLYDDAKKFATIGSISNPGSLVWQDLLEDRHPYQGVPHTAGIINIIRTLGNPERPYFMSEYGIGSGLNLFRMIRLYEQAGKEDSLDALGYRKRLEWFLNDWNKWNMVDTFGTPNHYLDLTLAEMGLQRLVGLNAIRANPYIIGHSVTGTADQGNSGEGVITLFRELKPNSMDDLIDGWAPLRWCLFAEPIQLYSGDTVHLEAVMANEDILKPGIQYPAQIRVIDPDGKTVFVHDFEFAVPEKGQISDLPPLAFKVFDQRVRIEGPTGEYTILATLEKGAAPYGQEYSFYVTNRDNLPAVKTEVLLWGEDEGLRNWLAAIHIAARKYDPAKFTTPRVILVGTQAAGGKEAFTELARQIARGSMVIFLDPGVFKLGDNPVALLPLTNKGNLKRLDTWLYHKDDWSTKHPFFRNLPTGVMNYQYYREIVSAFAFAEQDVPAEIASGSINTTMGYSSGLTLTVHQLGSGKFVLNTLQIRNNLGSNPVADHLLRNMINHMAEVLPDSLKDVPVDFDQQLQSMGY